MNHQLLQYISFARGRKMEDKDIQANLVSSGWDADDVAAALKAGDDALLMPPPPPAPAGAVSGKVTGSVGSGTAPIAVIQQRTTRGLEYIIMFLAMGVTAISLGALLHNLVDGAFGYSNEYSGLVSYAAAAIIVSLPIFAILFLRLKRAEVAEPTVRADPSRRHAVQLTLIVTFLWGLFRLVTYIYSLMNGSNAESFVGSNITSPVGNLLHTLVTVGIAGGIFAYYWVDEHRKGQQ